VLWVVPSPASIIRSDALLIFASIL
jgi:hypothetical protein